MGRRSNSDIARDVVRLPIEFKSRRNVSMHALMIEAGFLEQHENISVADISAALRESPHCVPAWADYSCDKRSGAGWFFRPDSDGAWEVGYVDGDTVKDVKIFKDKIDACAFFIKKEFDSIRKQ